MHPLPATVAAFWQRVQTTLFPYLTAVDVALTPPLEQLVAILEVLRVEDAVPSRTGQVGAPPNDRGALPQRLQTDTALRRICGWATAAAVPSEATFSRAFARFADLGLADAVHDEQVRAWLGDTLVWHQALDATDIAARAPDSGAGRRAATDTPGAAGGAGAGNRAAGAADDVRHGGETRSRRPLEVLERVSVPRGDP